MTTFFNKYGAANGDEAAFLRRRLRETLNPVINELNSIYLDKGYPVNEIRQLIEQDLLGISGEAYLRLGLNLRRKERGQDPLPDYRSMGVIKVEPIDESTKEALKKAIELIKNQRSNIVLDKDSGSWVNALVKAENEKRAKIAEAANLQMVLQFFRDFATLYQRICSWYDNTLFNSSSIHVVFDRESQDCIDFILQDFDNLLAQIATELYKQDKDFLLEKTPPLKRDSAESKALARLKDFEEELSNPWEEKMTEQKEHVFDEKTYDILCKRVKDAYCQMVEGDFQLSITTFIKIFDILGIEDPYVE